MKTVVKQLSSGYEVEVRAVPPAFYLDVELQYNRDNPPPRKPTIKAKSVAGHVEEVVAAMDSPEWVEYERAMALRDQDLMSLKLNSAYDYAVVKWCKGPNTLIGWVSEPPSDWNPDPLCPDKTSSRRVLFIKYELIASLVDDRTISNPFPVAPVSEEEIAAALDKFPNNEERQSDSGAHKRKGRNG